MGAALPPLVMRQQPAQDIPIDTGNRYGALLTAMFAFNRSFRSSTKRSGNPVITAGPMIQAGPNGFYAVGNGSGKVVTDFLPSDIGFSGATARTFVTDFYMTDTNSGRCLLSLGDSSGTRQSQFTLLVNSDYRQVSLQTYNVDIAYSPYTQSGTGARVFLMVAYDGNKTFNFYSLARLDVGGQLVFNSLNYVMDSPLVTGNTVPLNLMGGGTYGFPSMNTALDYLALFGGSSLTLADFYSLYQNRWQVFQKPRMQGLARTLAIMPASAPAVTLAGTVQSVTSASGVLSTSIALAGAPAARAAASGTLTTLIALASNASAVSSAAGNLSSAISLAGAAAASVSATGNISTTISFSATVAAVATVSGNLSTALGMAAAMQSVATVTGSLLVGSGLSAAMQASASATGSLATAITMAGSTIARTTVSGALTTAIPLAANAQAVSLMSGTLAGTAVMLSAALSATVSAVGALTTALPLSAVARSVAAISANLKTALALRAALSSSATVQGALMTGPALIDVTKISPARIVVFEGSGSRVVKFDSSGSRVVVFDVPER